MCLWMVLALVKKWFECWIKAKKKSAIYFNPFIERVEDYLVYIFFLFTED